MKKRKTIGFFLKSLIRPDLWDEAAALTFYVIFAIFPALLIMVSIISFLPFQELVDEYYFWWSHYLPQSVRESLQMVIADVKKSDQTKVLSFGFLASFWAASSGVGALTRQLNHVHGLKETRSLVKQRLIYFLVAASLGVTLIISFFILVLGQLITNMVADALYLSQFSEIMVGLFRFTLVGVLLLFVLSMLYYVCPDRKGKSSSIFPGSLLASVLLLLGSGVYGFYINDVTNYSATYGSIGAVIGLLFWLYLIAMSTLMGALFNEALDR